MKTLMVALFSLSLFGPALAAPKEGSSSKPASKGAEASAAKVPAALAATVAAYEQSRALLGKDKLEAAVKHARVLEKAAKAAQGKVAKGKAQLGELAGAAAAMAKAPASDGDAVRRAFGEVSRHMVSLAAADPALADALHVFECAMAQGYKKWVQKKPEIENPYMGKRMPKCGAKSEWKI